MSFITKITGSCSIQPSQEVEVAVSFSSLIHQLTKYEAWLQTVNQTNILEIMAY